METKSRSQSRERETWGPEELPSEETLTRNKKKKKMTQTLSLELKEKVNERMMHIEKKRMMMIISSEITMMQNLIFYFMQPVPYNHPCIILTSSFIKDPLQ